MSARIGPREQALRAMREAESKPVPVTALKKIVEAPAPMKKDRPVKAGPETKPEAPAPETQKETTVKTPKTKKAAQKTPKKAPAAAARKAPAAPKNPPKGKTPPPAKNAPAGSAAQKPPKPENKMDIVERMLKAGATRKELSEATGWPHVNLKMAAKRAGEAFELAKDGEKFRLIAKAA